MKKIFSITLSAILAAGISLSNPVYAINSDSMAGIVSTESGRLNIRNSAGGYIVTSVPKGSYLALIEKNGDWWKVEYSEGKFGYCHSDYIEIVSDTAARVSTQNGNLNVRSGAGRSYPVIGTVSKDENVIILSSTGYWSRILFDGNKTGVVSADYLSVIQKGYPEISLDVPDYKQTDPRWANVKIGYSGKTIGKIGCVTTGIAMMESFRSGKTIYPDAMMRKLSYDYSGNVYWPEDYSVGYWSENYLKTVYNKLREGKPVLIGAKAPAGNQHWVVITGFKGGKTLSPSGFTINDPGSKTNTNLQQFFNSFSTLYKFFWY
ncbi:MAG: SH3 domain-containing protein [Oscillospiraceae bacterium]|nr:SH3 domain-containing protein [Oscillospiraceae bacterium]